MIEFDHLVSIRDRGLAYGHGVFETMEVSDGELPHWSRHWKRFSTGCRRLGLPVPHREALYGALMNNVPLTGRFVLKLIMTAGDGNRGYASPSDMKPRYMMATQPWPEYPATHTDKGIAVRYCKTSIPFDPLLAGIKHLNRLHQVLARSEWNDKKIVEGLMLDPENRVIEGTMSNLFWVEKDKLYTPDLSQCGVSGIMRERIIEWCKSIGLSVHIDEITPAKLLETDGLFVCNSIIGIWPVNCLDNHKMPIPHLILNLLEAIRKGVV